ncbi:MAG: DUF115 domain-containing protein [Spirochaetia bacterium]|nr:DUF115 domain-containing protein [Spirochaetia bacterium]
MNDNIQELLGKKPYLEPYFYGQPYPETLCLENAKNGQKIICKQKKNDIIRLSSIYNPQLEAERIIPADVNLWQAGQIVILLGLGNPYLFSNIEKVLQPNQICIAIDAQFEMGKFLCSNFEEPMQFLKRPGCHMFCGPEMEEGLVTYLESLPGEKLRGVKLLSHKPSINLEPEYYHYIEDLIQNAFRSRISDLLTRFEFEKLWIKNIIANSAFFPENKNRSALPVNLLYYKGILNGIPALLVSAGPSLRRSLPVIKKLASKCFILACDTSVKVLKAGNVPFHGVITLDAQKHSIFHFQGVDLSESILFADIVSNPGLIEDLNPGKIIFSTTARFTGTYDGRVLRECTPGTEYIEEFHGILGSLQSGGSVATSGFDLLRFLGAGEIFLIGQDLAYTGREIHSTGTHHNEKWLGLLNRTETLEGINEKIIRKRETYQVPSLHEESVLTDFVLDLYRSWFEQSIPDCGIRTWNLSSDGAFLKGAVRPENLDAWIDALPEIDHPEKLFQDASSPQKHHSQKNLNFYSDLKHTLMKNDSEFSSFMEKYPFTETLMRKMEVYLLRNQEKLEKEKSREIHGKYFRKILKELERGLRPYIKQTS